MALIQVSFVEVDSLQNKTKQNNKKTTKKQKRNTQNTEASSHRFKSQAYSSMEVPLLSYLGHGVYVSVM